MASPTSTWLDVSKFRTKDCAHCPACPASPASTCTIFSECRTMDCTHYINLPNQPQLHQPHQLLLPASASLNLTTLNLAGCTQVSNNELRVLATLTALTSLNLGYCSDNGSDNRLRTTWSGRTTGSTQVSDNGLRALAGLTALTGLNLGYCARVSDNGLEALYNNVSV